MKQGPWPWAGADWQCVDCATAAVVIAAQILESAARQTSALRVGNAFAMPRLAQHHDMSRAQAHQRSPLLGEALARLHTAAGHGVALAGQGDAVALANALSFRLPGRFRRALCLAA